MTPPSLPRDFAAYLSASFLFSASYSSHTFLNRKLVLSFLQLSHQARARVRSHGTFVRMSLTASTGEILLAVEGKRADANAGESLHKTWHSTGIVARVSARLVKTASGVPCPIGPAKQ